MGRCIVDGVIPRFDLPFSPRSDHLQLGSQRLDSQFEPDLVVALSGRSVGNGIRPFFQSDLHQVFGNDGPCNGSPQKIFLFVDGTGFHHGPSIFPEEFIPQIQDIRLAGPGFDGLVMDRSHFFPLTDIRRYGNHFTIVVVFLQPRNDAGSIQPA